MFTRILVPVDGSELSEVALRRADELLTGQPEGVLIVLRVYELPGVSIWGPMNSAVTQERERQAVKAYLDKLNLDYLNRSYKLETLTHPGPVAADAIIDVARDKEAELIVISSHGRTGLSSFLLGSVTRRVAQGAPCSVMVLKEKSPSS